MTIENVPDLLPEASTRSPALPGLPPMIEAVAQPSVSVWSIPYAVTPRQRVAAECHVMALKPVLRPAGNAEVIRELGRLVVAFPSKARDSDHKVRAWAVTYADRLAYLPLAALHEAVDACLDQCPMMPSIKDILARTPAWYGEAQRVKWRLERVLRNSRVQEDPSPAEREAVKLGFAELIGRLRSRAA